MKEFLQNQPTQQEVTDLKPDSGPTQKVDVPTLSYDKRDGIIWRVKGGTPEDNLRLGINNIQALVISEVPELATFPRDENGRIKEEDREQVESLILERVRRNKTLRGARTHKNRTLYPEQHENFRRYLLSTLRITFDRWGLFEDKEKQFLEANIQLEVLKTKKEQNSPSKIILIDSKTNTRSTIKPIDQKRGRVKLAHLVKGELSIDDIEPIYINDLKREKNNTILYLYAGSKTLRTYLCLNLASYKAYEEKGGLLAIPKKDIRFGYQWLDFYAVEQDDTADLNKKLDSVRVNTDTGKFENQGWNGPEQQAFIDYISGVLKIADPSEFPPFIAKIKKHGKNKEVYLGVYQGKIYTIKFNHPLDISSQEVLIKTKSDSERGYQWFEGYDIADKECSQPLFTKRIIEVETEDRGGQQENKKEKELVEWKGPQIQSIIDWAYGRLSIDGTQDTKVFIDKQRSTDKHKKKAFLYLKSPNLTINMEGNAKLDKSQPLYLVPKESGPYKWIEVQQDSSNNKDDLNNNGIRQTITLVRIMFSDGIPKSSSDWQGEEKQALVDYIDGKIDSQYLKSLKLQVAVDRKNLRVHVVSYRNKDLRINLDTKLFSPGEIVQIVPKVTTNDSTKEEALILEVSHENDETVLKRFKYDKEKEQFYVLDEQKEEITSGEAPTIKKTIKSENTKPDFDPSELPPELRQEILDRFAEFLEHNPDTQISVIDFTIEYLQKDNLTL